MRLRVIRKHTALDIYIVSCRFHETTQWVSERSRHTEIIYPLTGGFLLRHGADMLCYPGRLSVLPAGTRFEVAHLPRFADETLVFKLKQLPGGVVQRVRRLHGPAHRLLGPGAVYRLHVLAMLLAGDSVAPGEIDTPALVMARNLLDGLLAHGQVQNNQLSWQIKRLEPATREIAVNSRANTIDDLAASTSYSNFHFHRRFRETHGITPHQAVLANRVAVALTRLHRGETLNAAALAAGFNNAQHLSARLRAIGGLAYSRLMKLQARDVVRWLRDLDVQPDGKGYCPFIP